MKTKTYALRGACLSLLSGVVLWLAFPPLKLGGFAWMALAIVFTAQIKYAPTRRLFGLYAALGPSVTVLLLIRGVPAGYTLLYAAPVLVFALIYLFTFWQRELALKNNAKYFTALAALGIIATEFIRQPTPIGQFACLAMTQIRHPIFLQIVSMFGVYGVTVLIVVVNCTLALFVAYRENLKAVNRQMRVNGLIIMGLMLANIILWVRPIPEIGRIKVAAAQFGYVPEAKTHQGLKAFDAAVRKKDFPGAARLAIDALEPITRTTASRGAQLIVWPETILDVDPDKHPDIQRRVTAIARGTRATFVFGHYNFLPGHEKEANPPGTNKATVIGPDGRALLVYEKIHRVTSFGVEKGPVGHDPGVVDTPAGRLGVMICYDADYQDVARAAVKNGAKILIVPSHDLALFLTRLHPWMAYFRAIELRRSLVKSDYVFGTLIVDPKGRVLADPADGRNISVTDVPLTDDANPQLPIILFPWLAAAALAVCVALAARDKG